jgi:hypothetical protein
MGKRLLENLMSWTFLPNSIFRSPLFYFLTSTRTSYSPRNIRHPAAMKPTATRSLEQTPERTSEHEKHSIVPVEPAQPSDVEDDDIQYLTGIGLFGVVLALCLCGFLLALDSSILATVSIQSPGSVSSRQ